MSEPWEGLVAIDEVRKRRAAKPRATGLTMVIDTGLGLSATADMIASSAAHVDVWKLSFGTSVFVPRELLEDKLRTLRARGVATMPGGTLFEAAVVRQPCEVYMKRALELGFTAVEISDGTIELPPPERERTIKVARDMGLCPITEVGKKDPANQPSAERLAELALDDLAWGAEAVIVEGRESGKSVGVYDRDGNPDMDAIEVIARILGASVGRLIWEAPLKVQQTSLIERFGPNVGLGNIEPQGLAALEALRAGLRFETLKPLAEAWRRDGRLRAEPAKAAPPRTSTSEPPLEMARREP